MTRPLVTVCVPVYNPGTYLQDALDSILSQDFHDSEILVVDDGSEEPVAELVGSYSDPRVRFERNASNLGLVASWNRCLELAQGQFVTIFHQDDVMGAGNLSAKVAMLERRPAVGFVHSNIVSIDESGKRIGGHWAAQPTMEGITPGKRCFELLATRGNFIACPSVMARASCYQRLGRFDERLPFTCDLEMWMRIASAYDMGYLSAPLISYRTHPGQETRRYSGKGQEVREVRRALDIAFSRSAAKELDGRLRVEAYRNLVRWAYRMGKCRAAQRRWRAAVGYFAAGAEALARSYIG